MQRLKSVASVFLAGATLAGLLPFLTSPAMAAETTLLLCEGSNRNTARIYQKNGKLMMRIYDRRGNATWYNGAARSATNPEVTIYTNVMGEQKIQIEASRNSPTNCSIQVGNQTLERGRVIGGSSGKPPTSEDLSLVCVGNKRNTARIYQKGRQLMMQLTDRNQGTSWFNGAARTETNPEVITYINTRGEQEIRVSTNRNAPSSCAIKVGNQPLEPGRVTQRGK